MENIKKIIKDDSVCYDEYESNVRNKAWIRAGNYSTFTAILLAIVIWILNWKSVITLPAGVSDYLVMFTALVGLLHSLIFSLYDFIMLKKKSRLVDVVLFTVFIVYLTYKFLTY